MKKEFLLLFAFLLILASCDSDISKINWAPMANDIGYIGELKMILLLEGDLAKINRCSVLEKITDEDKVSEVEDALDDAMYFCRSYDPFIPKANQKAICFVHGTDDDHLIGYLIRTDWDTKEEKVAFAGGYSKGLYKVLTEYGVIESEKKPDAVPFSSDPELAKIEFVPMPEYAGCQGKLKKVVFLEGDHYDFIFRRTENWQELAKVTDPKEIEKIKQAFSDARYCVMHFLDSIIIETMIAFIYEDGRGELLRIDPNIKDRIVEFQGGYSEDLYNILAEYGIINDSPEQTSPGATMYPLNPVGDKKR